jgi:protein TonB
MVAALVHAALVVTGAAAALTRAPALPQPTDAIAVTLAFESAAPVTEPKPPGTVEAPPETRPAPAQPAPLEAIVPAEPASPPVEIAPAASALPEAPVATPKVPVPPPAPRPVPRSHATAPSMPGPAEVRPALEVYHPSGPTVPAAPLQSAPPPLTAPRQEASVPVVPPHPASGLASNRKPVYPVEARSRHETGRVVLRVQVSVAGSAAAVDIITSSGHPLLDQAALAAILAWRFDPATRAGLAVPGQVDVPVDFRMDD